MIDHLANRQTAGLAGADHAELNLKFDAIARYFDLDWLTRNGDKAHTRLLEFFAAQIRNAHTRRAYSAP